MRATASSALSSARTARGLRLKSVRRALCLSRVAFSERFGISKNTLQNWEDNKNGGLTENAAQHVIQLFKQAGVHCTLGWLMFGTDAPPSLPNFVLAENSPLPFYTHTDDQFVQKELALFHSHYPDQAVDTVVQDDGMLPQFRVGEIVAGLKHTGKKIEAAIGQSCIVQTREHGCLVRQLKPGTQTNRFTLTCINPNTAVLLPIQYDVDIIFAAPVVWSRKKL